MITERDCETCKIVRLMPENYFAWKLIQELIPGLFSYVAINTGEKITVVETGLNYEAIEIIFRNNHVAAWEWNELWEKIVACSYAVRETRSE